MKKLLATACLLLIGLLPAAQAASLDDILSLGEAPTGVVIEIVEPGAEQLKALMPKIAHARKVIRERFPELPVAVVSHGHEQFSLTRDAIKDHPELETGVKSMVDNDVDVHVCGTHASWYGVSPEDYPEYINVSETGPAQINDYLNIGYIALEL